RYTYGIAENGAIGVVVTRFNQQVGTERDGGAQVVLVSGRIGGGGVHSRYGIAAGAGKQANGFLGGNVVSQQLSGEGEPLAKDVIDFDDLLAEVEQVLHCAAAGTPISISNRVSQDYIQDVGLRHRIDAADRGAG